MGYKICETCKRNKKIKENFYKTKNREKYPDGYLNICKQCLTWKIDVLIPETYLWILKECDIPYTSEKWEAICQKQIPIYGLLHKQELSTVVLSRYFNIMDKESK